MLSLNEAPKAHVFCYSFNVLLFSKNQTRLLCQISKALFIVKLALYVQPLCLLIHNNFLVFNISGNCWKSSHNLWTLPNHNSRSLEGLGFRACYSASAQSPTTPFWKPNVLGEVQESVLFEIRDKSLCVKLVITSLVEHNLNQQISISHFRFFNSTCKVTSMKVLVHLRLSLTQPYHTSGCWGFLSLQFRWNFICLHVFR